MARSRLPDLAHSQPQLLDTRRPEGPVDVLDPIERDIYDRLVAHMQLLHPEADLSWMMMRTDEQRVFIGIDDAETGQPFYVLRPWMPECPYRAYEMVACSRGDRRMHHSHSLPALASLAVDRMVPAMSSMALH